LEISSASTSTVILVRRIYNFWRCVLLGFLVMGGGLGAMSLEGPTGAERIGNK